MATISIIGCGWLGLPLGQHLAKLGHTVKGSTTTESKLNTLTQAGIEAHPLALNLHSDQELTPLLQADIAIITVPPRTQEGEPQYYLRLLQNLANKLADSPVQQVLFTGATSVYPQDNHEVTEKDAQRIESPFSDTPWLDIEEVFTKATGFDATIVRFSGLIGGSYQPGRYFSGKPLGGASDPVNMIHRDDCIGVISAIIEQGAWGDAFNASACEHPSRRELYSASCDMAGIPRPEFADTPKPYRIVNCDKLKQQLGYQFKYPNPLNALGK